MSTIKDTYEVTQTKLLLLNKQKQEFNILLTKLEEMKIKIGKYDNIL